MAALSALQMGPPGWLSIQVSSIEARISHSFRELSLAISSAELNVRSGALSSDLAAGAALTGGSIILVPPPGVDR
jgi:hypothetical protein